MTAHVNRFRKYPIDSNREPEKLPFDLSLFSKDMVFRFWCKKSIKLGHTDTITLKRCVIGMEKKNLFKWKHYQPDIIL
ncbi:hypothetical protein, partial [Bacillus clarus]